MRTPAGPRFPLAVRASSVLISIGVAVVLALALAVFTLGSRPFGLVASAELAAGAALQAQNGWVLPATFSVFVFTGMVGMTMLIGRPSIDGTRPASAEAPAARSRPEPPLALENAMADQSGQARLTP